MRLTRLLSPAANRFLPAVLLLVTACGSPVVSDAQTFNRSAANKMFVSGFQNIDDSYIDSVDLMRLTVSGLSGLSNIDPNLNVSMSGDSIRINNGDTTAAAFSAPDRDSPRAWAEITTNAISIARNVSPALRNADSEDIYRVVFEGVLSQLDRFSRYAGHDRAEDNRAARDGFGGIGVRVEVDASGVRIIEVLPATPASDVNLRVDDSILRIDDRETAGMDQNEVIHRLRGRIGDIVQLSVRRPGSTGLMTVDLRREQIVMPTVFYSRQANAAYIRITGFNARTAKSLVEALEQSKREIGRDLVGFILDMRGNPGGLLDQAVDVSDDFLTEGRILTSHGRHSDSHQRYDARNDDFAAGLPVVVLMNGGSASAAEIVAAALQDTGRAAIVGAASYGKGSLQTVITLPNEGELTLTWARLHAPSGHSFHEYGVIPNVCTAGHRTGEEVLSNLAEITSRMRAAVALARSGGPGDSATIAESRSACPWRSDGPDIDLEVALKILQSPKLYATAIQGSRPAIAAKPKTK